MKPVQAALKDSILLGTGQIISYIATLRTEHFPLSINDFIAW